MPARRWRASAPGRCGSRTAVAGGACGGSWARRWSVGRSRSFVSDPVGSAGHPAAKGQVLLVLGDRRLTAGGRLDEVQVASREAALAAGLVQLGRHGAAGLPAV